MLVLIDPQSNRTIDPNSKRFSLLQKRAATGPVDPYYSYVTALLHFNGGSLSPMVSNAPSGSATWSASTATYTTAQSVFGGSSLDMTVASSYCIASTNAPLTLGSGNWTVEFWCRFTTTAGDQVLTNLGFPGGSGAFQIYKSSANTLRVNQATDVSLGAWPGIATGVWFFVAVVNLGGTVYGYIDGVQTSTTTPGTTIADLGGGCRVGGHSTVYFTGYMDDYRITKGIARYTTNFTPPAAPFPNR